jgi:hypothetical protein
MTLSLLFMRVISNDVHYINIYGHKCHGLDEFVHDVRDGQNGVVLPCRFAMMDNNPTWN